MLMQTLEQQAETDESACLDLDTRTDDPSQGLCEQLGYEDVGVIPGYAKVPPGKPIPTTFVYKHLLL